MTLYRIFMFHNGQLCAVDCETVAKVVEARPMQTPHIVYIRDDDNIWRETGACAQGAIIRNLIGKAPIHYQDSILKKEEITHEETR